MVRYILFLFSVCISLSSLSAQSSPVQKRDGEKAYADGRWADAYRLLSAYQQANPGDAGIITRLGIASFHLGKGEEARRYLEYVVSVAAGGKDAESLYYLSLVYQGLGDWERAIASWKSFLKIAGEKHPFRENAADNIRRCVTGSLLFPNENVVLLENMGSLVNSAGDEFAPLPSVNHRDLIYFAGARKGSNGDLRNEEGFEDLARGRYCSDMYKARLENSGWETAGSIGGLLNTARFEVPLGFSANGQILYFSGDIPLTQDNFLPIRPPEKMNMPSTRPPLFLPCARKTGTQILFSSTIQRRFSPVAEQAVRADWICG